MASLIEKQIDILRKSAEIVDLLKDSLTETKIRSISVRIANVLEDVLNGSAVKCPECGEEMKMKESREGHPFYGCKKYPGCSGALSLDDILHAMLNKKSGSLREILKR